MQSSEFETQSMHPNVLRNSDFGRSSSPGFPVASIATTIASSIASAITSTNSSIPRLTIPEIIPVVLENGEPHYVPRIFAEKLSRTESLLERERKNNESSRADLEIVKN